MQNDYTVLIPSFTTEKKTKALYPGVWGFVGLVSMFTVGIGVFTTHLMFVAVLEIASTFISDNSVIIIPGVILLFGVLFGIGLFCFLSNLQTAYVIQPDKIIKGKITDKAVKIDGKSLGMQAASTAYMAANLGNGSKVSGANAVKNMFGIVEMICLNMEQGFAQEFFFTEGYKRKEYHNPRLIKENKYFYTYLCDNKKLKIRKIYTGMDRGVLNAKSVSILKRVVIKSLLIFAAFSALSVADIAIGLAKNSSHMDHIMQSYTEIETALTELGYTSMKVNEKCYQFQKSVSDEETSYVKYLFKADGTIEDVWFEIFFDSSSDTVEQEIEFIFTSLNDGITEQQIEKFIQDAQATIQGDYVYNKLQTENHRIILGTSSGYAHIHN